MPSRAVDVSTPRASRDSGATSESSFRRGHRRDSDTIVTKDSVERAVRFPSSHITGESFVRIDSWHNERDTDSRESDRSNICSRICQCSCFRVIRGWPRTRQIALASCLIFFLFLVAASIVLLILLLVKAGQNDNNYHNDVYSSTVVLPSTTPFPQPSPFLQGYVSRTGSEYRDFGGNLTSLIPDIRGFDYTGKLLGYNILNNTVMVYDPLKEKSNVTTYNVIIDQLSCSMCQILMIDDQPRSGKLKSNPYGGIENRNLTQNEIIYCCTDCADLPSTIASRCAIRGAIFEVNNEIIERRVSQDGTSLLITTLSHASNTLQSFLINGTLKSTKIGPTSTCPVPNGNSTVIQASTVTQHFDEPGNLERPNQYVTVLDSLGSQEIYGAGLANRTVQYRMEEMEDGIRLMRATMIGEAHMLVAVVLKDRIYVTRQNLENGCITTLAGSYLSFHYDGVFIDADWLSDKLMMWFRERQGANVVLFEFSWPDDTECPSQR